jgi:hypothetical protein
MSVWFRTIELAIFYSNRPKSAVRAFPMLTLSVKSKNRETGKVAPILGLNPSHPWPGKVLAGKGFHPHQYWV